MNPQKRQTILIVVMLAMLAGAAAWSIDSAMDNADRAARAADALGQTRSLAEQIRQLRQAPTVARTGEIAITQMGREISSAAEAANLQPGSIQGVQPRPARRLGQSDYMTKATTISLQGVGLGQLTMFLYHISDRTNLTVSELQLQGRRDGQSGGPWNAQATVTYLIYAPAENN
ncbi:MAG: hypothetical protein ACOCZE_09385 [Planctomycetota bacterium]